MEAPDFVRQKSVQAETIGEMDVSVEMRPCVECGREHLGPIDNPGEPCFRCWRAAHPFEGCPAARIDAAGEDSRDPRRQAEGTHRFNMGLRGVDQVVGVRRSTDPNLNGLPKKDYRPLTNAEVGSNANLRELAKRQGLKPVESGGVYRMTPR